MNRYLIRSWVYPFYKTYAGFLFVIFLFAAGFLRAEEHVALGFFFTSHVKNLIYPIAGFILYEMLTIHFSIKWVSERKNWTIRELFHLDAKDRYKSLTIIIFYLHIPVIFYTLFLLCIALLAGKIIVLFVVLLLAAARFLLYTQILNRVILFPVEKQFKSFHAFSRPSIFYFPIANFSLKYIMSQRLLSLFLGKLLSLGMLFIFIFLIQTVDHYHRFSSIGILMVFIANAYLSFDLFSFHNLSLSIVRNLPIKPGLILVQTLLIMFILTLPEIVIIYKNFSQIIEAGFIAIHIINGLVLLLFLYAYLIYFNVDQRMYISQIFWGSIFVIMLMLFDFPVYLLILILCSCTFYFYFKGYYQFETLFTINDK